MKKNSTKHWSLSLNDSLETLLILAEQFLVPDLKDRKSLFSITKQSFGQKQMSSGRFERKTNFYLIDLNVFLKTWLFNDFLLSESGGLRGILVLSGSLPFLHWFWTLFLLWTFVAFLCVWIFRLSLWNAWALEIWVKPNANDTNSRTFILKRGLCSTVNILACFLTLPVEVIFLISGTCRARKGTNAILRARRDHALCQALV